MSVFRAPYERVFHSLGAILDREEVILARRTDPLADAAAQTALDARIAWIGKGKEIEPKIARVEKWIWLSVAMSAAGLLCSALWPAIELSRLLSLVILVACLAPLAYGTLRISLIVNDAFHVVRKQIAEL